VEIGDSGDLYLVDDPGVPMAWFSLGFLAFVLGLLALRPDTRLALCVMPAWFIWLGIAYRFSRFQGASLVNT
jgi:D-serine/D-alanine/glycine transporter